MQRSSGRYVSDLMSPMLPLGHVLNDKLILSSSPTLVGTECVRLLGNYINSPLFIGSMNVALLKVLYCSVCNDTSL